PQVCPGGPPGTFVLRVAGECPGAGSGDRAGGHSGRCAASWTKGSGAAGFSPRSGPEPLAPGGQNGGDPPVRKKLPLQPSPFPSGEYHARRKKRREETPD